MDHQTRALLDRTGFDMQQIRDEQKRINARLDKLCSTMNAFCAEARTALAGMGGTIAEPSDPYLGSEPSALPSRTHPSDGNLPPHQSSVLSTEHPAVTESVTRPVAIPELDITRGLTAGPLRKS